MCAQLSAVCSKRPKTPGCRCWGSSHFLAKYAFKWLAPSRLEIRIGAGVHFVELTCGGIRLHLLVPLVLGQGMQFGHQLAVFARRELGNGFPNFGDCGHARTLQNVSKRGKSNQGPDDRQSYARSHSRADHLANFISLIFRCSVRRLMPSFLAAAVTFPFVVASACVISLLSVWCRSSGLDFSSNAFAAEIPRGDTVPAACRTAIGRSRTVTFGPVAITTPCSIAVRNSRTLPGQL